MIVAKVTWPERLCVGLFICYVCSSVQRVWYFESMRESLYALFIAMMLVYDANNCIPQSDFHSILRVEWNADISIYVYEHHTTHSKFWMMSKYICSMQLPNALSIHWSWAHFTPLMQFKLCLFAGHILLMHFLDACLNNAWLKNQYSFS